MPSPLNHGVVPQRWVTPGRTYGAGMGSLTGASPNASSIAASASGASSMPDAFALAWTCSGREAPTIADATSRRRSTQGEGQLDHREPRVLGDRPQALDGLEGLVVHHELPHRGAQRAGCGTRVRRRCLTRAVLARQHSPYFQTRFQRALPLAPLSLQKTVGRRLRSDRPPPG